MVLIRQKPLGRQDGGQNNQMPISKVGIGVARVPSTPDTSGHGHAEVLFSF